ncbi:MAG: sel1 repeat family protein [Bacteroidales bacterium]|nr:sel1 repeat family protein [Bacteroidales bacterium]
MGLFDLFGKSGNESSLKRNNTSQNSFLQDLLHGSNNPCAGAIEITFDYHQRYENGNPVLGEQNHKRTLKIEKNVSGDIGYTVSINPSMSPKRMKVISCSNDKIKLQGYGYDNNAVMMGVPKEAASFECYALTLNVASSGVLDRAIISCDLHLLDRNIDLKYYRHSKEEKETISTNQEDAQAQYNAGILYMKQKDYKKAVHYFTQSAKQGFVLAQYNLGVCYLNGEKEFHKTRNKLYIG